MEQIKYPYDAATSQGNVKNFRGNIIARMLKKINCCFLEDEETGERAPASDHFIFYGALGFILVVGVYFAYKLIVF